MRGQGGGSESRGNCPRGPGVIGRLKELDSSDRKSLGVLGGDGSYALVTNSR